MFTYRIIIIRHCVYRDGLPVDVWVPHLFTCRRIHCCQYTLCTHQSTVFISTSNIYLQISSKFYSWKHMAIKLMYYALLCIYLFFFTEKITSFHELIQIQNQSHNIARPLVQRIQTVSIGFNYMWNYILMSVVLTSSFMYVLLRNPS